MSHVQFTDELVREYLIFRGFSSTAKAFDNDLKLDKDKGFRVDRIVEQLVQCVYNYDLTGLREVWSHLDTRLFIRLEHNFAPAIRKLENALLKFYLVNASENNKQDKITDFFTKLTSEFLGQSEWKDWFVLPFVKNPEEHASFAVYFTRQWQDTLIVSLQNFLSAVYQCMPQPTLSSFEDNLMRILELQKENEIMRKGIANLLTCEDKVPDKTLMEDGLDLLMDDFYVISQEVKSNENQTKILKSLMRNIGSVPPSPKLEMRSEQPLRTSHRMFSVRRAPQTKRSMSIDRSGQFKTRERDSSLDLSSMRSKESDKRGEADKGQERSFLFLSQEEYSEHKARVTTIKINNRGNLVASGDAEGNLRIWSISSTCKTSASLTVKSSITCLDWVPNHERYVVFGTGNSLVGLYDIKEMKLMWEINMENDTRKAKINDIVSSPVDSTAVAVSGGRLFLIDLKQRRVEKSLNATCDAVCARLSHNGQLTVVGGANGLVQLLDVRRNEVVDEWETHAGAVLQMRLTADYTTVYTLGKDNKICCKSLNHAKGKATVFAVPSPTGRMLAIDNRGKYLLTAGVNSGVIYKMSETGLTKSLELGGHKTGLTCVDWSFANQCATCVTASQDGKIKISTLLVDTV